MRIMREYVTTTLKITKHVNIYKIFPDTIILFLSKYFEFSCFLCVLCLLSFDICVCTLCCFLLLATWLLNQHVKRQEFNSVELHQ